MNLVHKTLNDLAGIDYVLTRFDKSYNLVPDDLDILVKPVDFLLTTNLLRAKGYTASSHDKALGGRLPGMQVNLTRPDRIKIDLHQDFTWRKSHYLDLDLIWNKFPQIDMFLVLVNTIFEKTYLLQSELEYLKTFTPDPVFQNQATKYGWCRSYAKFLRWLSRAKINSQTPVFIPISLVLFSYVEKFEPISFLYYLFFRIRYAIKRKLPYH